MPMSLPGSDPRDQVLSSTPAIDLVKLRSLMDRSEGIPDVRIALIDGPVVLDHPGFSGATIGSVSAADRLACERAHSDACVHGTLVAGVLVASRDSGAPGICPQCTLLVRPIFFDAATAARGGARATLEDVAAALTECVAAGAGVINISASLDVPSCTNERCIHDALEYAVRRRVIVVVAGGNQNAIGSSVMTRHSWAIPVVACGANGRPTPDSNLSHSIGRWGLAAPGEEVSSLASQGGIRRFSGTSAAAPFVTGTVALLWSLFPRTTANDMRAAILQPKVRRGRLVPPVLDAEAAFAVLAGGRERVAS
jgi:subtilisin family serine protease